MSVKENRYSTSENERFIKLENLKLMVSSWMKTIREIIDQNREVLERVLDVNDTLLILLCGHKYMGERTKQKIQSRDTATGKGAEFLSWLSSCSDNVVKEVMKILRHDKQHHVVNFMEGKEVDLPLSDDIRSAVYILTDSLNACMDADGDLLERMLSKEALKLREYEVVKAKPTNTDKVNALLEIVLRKSMRSFNYLIDSLTETNQKHVANVIQTAIKGLAEAEKPKTKTRSEDSNQDFSEVSVVNGTRGTTKIDEVYNVNGLDRSYLPTKAPENTPKTRILFYRPQFSWKLTELIESATYLFEIELLQSMLQERIEQRMKVWRKPINASEALLELARVSVHQNSTANLLRVLQEKFRSTESLTTLVKAILIHLKTFDTTDEVVHIFREKFRSRESLTTLVEAILSHLLNTGNQSSNFDHAVNGKRGRSNTSKSTQFATNDAFLSILKKRRTHNDKPPFRCFNDTVHNHLASLIQVG